MLQFMSGLECQSIPGHRATGDAGEESLHMTALEEARLGDAVRVLGAAWGLNQPAQLKKQVSYQG